MIRKYNKIFVIIIALTVLLAAGCRELTEEEILEQNTEKAEKQCSKDFEVILDYLAEPDDEKLDAVIALYAYMNNEEDIRNYLESAADYIDFESAEIELYDDEYKGAYLYCLGMLYDEEEGKEVADLAIGQAWVYTYYVNSNQGFFNLKMTYMIEVEDEDGELGFYSCEISR